MDWENTMAFVKAEKTQSKLRMAISAPAGAGKTYTALNIATALGGRIAVIDTEHGSAAKYADEFDFDVCELSDYNPKNYLAALREAEIAGYNVVIIDSLSHAWNGPGGVLQIKDSVAARKGGDERAGWREATPVQDSLVHGILKSNVHVIATMRAKTEYVQEKNDKGKTVIVKKGMAPIQRGEMEFEFDLFAEMDQEHNFIVSKTRIRKLDRGVFPEPGKELADTINEWLSSGKPQNKPSPPSTAPLSEVKAAGPNAVPTGTEQPADETGTSDDSATLKTDLILSLIDGAKEPKELESLVPQIKELPETHKKLVRAAYTNKKSALQLNGIAEATRVLTTP